MMRAKDLMTSPVDFLLWDKDLCKFATIEDVEKIVKIENDIYGGDIEFRLQCLGRYTKLADTGMTDKRGDKIYEGFILEVRCECMEEKYIFTGVVGFDKAGFALFDNRGDSAILSAFESAELEIIGNIYETPELLEKGLWQKKIDKTKNQDLLTTFISRVRRKLSHLCQ